MSASSTPNDSPVPMHQPNKAAHVAVPQAPLGNATNGLQVPGMGAKALLAKKMAKNGNPTYVSPTDNMLTPCTQKISAAKKKHFMKGSKPVNLFTPQSPATQEDAANDDEGTDLCPVSNENKPTSMPVDDDENPF
ncbi:hypothetical protein PUNSTDRAFT_112701 [Punctularia strigosozonata HHB-11173 SS5]|uniref:uncharacterized protein n=1 Tax=Punctularia strigosozonata (strain HHB-11173) TaxID=741275 RepID=UPI000441851C|nr:uncharacterized protein PUNSTDRAFT_112701 [Punctularia strigosozonata HHB-11173 SS5]EIN10909.1 hypothetical protein PUNSTDRAFT_112701 [Punctularia strigosozonata HHB-11173 SS5]